MPDGRPGAPRQSIFREKSLERAASPEKLDQYVKVSSPSSWIVLAAVLLLLAAALAWAFVGTLPTTTTVSLRVEGGRVTGSADLPDGTYDAQVTSGSEPVASLLFGE